jgi:glutamine phosphoribosylpyrophosphate amidotransferase
VIKYCSSHYHGTCEICGFVGIIGEQDAGALIDDGLIAIQHRELDKVAIAIFRNRFQG